MIKKKHVFIFGLLLAAHLIHIIEETLGNAYFIDSLYEGLTNFLIINIILWIIPIILLFYVIKKREIANYLGIIYSLIMILDGLDHIIRNYAGIYSGVALIILGSLLVYYLWKELKNMKGGTNMAEKLNVKRVSLSLGIVAGIVSIVCALLIALAPEFTINLFGAIFHGIDVGQIAKVMTFSSALLGTVEAIVLALIIGWLFAIIYNAIKA